MWQRVNFADKIDGKFTAYQRQLSFDDHCEALKLNEQQKMKYESSVRILDFSFVDEDEFEESQW